MATVKKYQNSGSPLKSKDSKRGSKTGFYIGDEPKRTPEQESYRDRSYQKPSKKLTPAQEDYWKKQDSAFSIGTKSKSKGLKMGGKIKKAQGGSTITRKTAGGEYKTKVTTDKTGAVTKIKDRRTLKGFLKGVPKGRGVITPEPVISAPKAKDGKWIQKATASIKKRGTEGKCTPITKPGCTGRAKALAKTFKKMAKARKGK